MLQSTPKSIQEFARQFNPAFQRYFLKLESEDTSFYKDLMYVETGITDLTIKESAMSGLAEASTSTGENSAIVGDSPIELFEMSYTQFRIETMMAFTEKHWKFGIQKRKLQGVIKELRSALNRKRERLAIGMVFDHAFDTSYSYTDQNGTHTVSTVGGDSVAAASAAHTRLDGGNNWSNVVTDQTGATNLPFDFEGLKAAHYISSLTPDHRGNPMNVDLDTLVCVKGSKVSFKAKEILKAIQKNELPGSFNHDGAAVGAFKVIELPALYVTAANRERWAMFDSKLKDMYHGYQYLESQPIKLDSPNLVYRTKQVEYTGTAWFTMGFNDIRGWVFSKGDRS